MLKRMGLMALGIGLVCGGLVAGPPEPYTAVKASAKEFGCLGRTVKLGDMLLPVQITSAGKTVLAAPVRIVAEPASALDGLAGKGTIVGNDGISAAWEWHGESAAFEIDARMTGDYDGLCWYEVELTPKRPVELTALRLVIPRIKGTARYLHVANFTWGDSFSSGLPERGGNWTGKFMPYVWLGDEERGLAWCCESDRGWRLSDPAKALSVSTRGNTVFFAANLLDHKYTISSPITLKFGLQASPVKPVSFAWRSKARIYHGVNYDWIQPGEDGSMPLDMLKNAGVKTVVFHDMWPEYYGQLKPSSPELLRQLINECHKRGLRLLLYIGYGLARNAPELQGHHDEWSAVPLIPWIPSFKPEYRTFDACCPRSGWADWLVTGVDKLFDEYKLDGLYFDGTSEAWKCENQSHGCGRQDSDGAIHPDYPVLAARSLMRRIADVARRHNPDAILDVHMSANLTLPTLSFCHSYWDGEQYESYVAADKVEIPLDKFRAEFMGYAHGLDAQFLCYENRPFSFDEAIAMAWVHGVEVRPGNEDQLEKVVPIWGALDRFGASSARWLPYWKSPGVTSDEDSVKVSSFVKDGKALLFVSHLKREPCKPVLRFDAKKLGLSSGITTAADSITGERLDLVDGTLSMSFDGMGWRMVELK